MITIKFFVLIVAQIVLSGCMSVPKFTKTDIDSAEQLVRELAFDVEYKAVPPEIMANNTLIITIKLFVTDSNVYKLYFSSNGRIFAQDQGMKAYGLLPLPTNDDPSKGVVKLYTYQNGIYHMDTGCSSENPYLFVITRRKSDGDMMCFDSGCESSLPVGWNSFGCKIERGNTLRLKG